MVATMKAILTAILLALAFPAMAGNEGSCEATAKSLDEGHYRSDMLALEGNKSKAYQLRKAYESGAYSFIEHCLKPRVCASYLQKFEHWYPPEYSKTGGEFTGFRDAWRVATTTGCQ